MAACDGAWEKEREKEVGKEKCTRWVTQQVGACALAERAAAAPQGGHKMALGTASCISHKFGQELLPALCCLSEWRKATASWKAPNFTMS